MRFVLFILTIPAFGAGCLILAFAKSAVHEIEAGICFLIGATFFAGAGICDAIVSRAAKLEQAFSRFDSQLPQLKASSALKEMTSIRQ